MGRKGLAGWLGPDSKEPQIYCLSIVNQGVRVGAGGVVVVKKIPKRKTCVIKIAVLRNYSYMVNA